MTAALQPAEDVIPIDAKPIATPTVGIIDISGSMQPVQEALNLALTNIPMELAATSIAKDVARLGLMTFSDHAQMVRPIGELTVDENVRPIHCGGSTNLTAALRLLDSELGRAVPQLAADGYSVCRPLVIVVTDGNPTSPDWEHALADLQARSYAPNIVSFGFGSMNASVLQRLCTIGAFQFREVQPDAATIAQFADKFVGTVIGSLTQGANFNVASMAPAGATVLPPIDVQPVA